MIWSHVFSTQGASCVQLSCQIYYGGVFPMCVCRALHHVIVVCWFSLLFGLMCQASVEAIVLHYLWVLLWHVGCVYCLCIDMLCQRKTKPKSIVEGKPQQNISITWASNQVCLVLIYLHNLTIAGIARQLYMYYSMPQEFGHQLLCTLACSHL